MLLTSDFAVVQLKSLSSYGLKGSVRTKGEGMELITLVNVEPCGLTAPEGFKGAASAANVAVYKVLEKPCTMSRRAHVPTEYEPLPPQELVQLSYYTSRGFNNSAVYKAVAAPDTRSLENGGKYEASMPTTNTGKDLTDAQALGHPVRHDANIGVAPPPQRRESASDDVPKTHEDVILSGEMNEIKYMDPLGPDKGYPDWQHR
jgi:hypothetical protein